MDGQQRRPDRTHWTTAVLDALDRERELGIGIRNGRIVVKTPPGEGFSASPAGAREVAASLNAAASLAEKQP